MISFFDRSPDELTPAEWHEWRRHGIGGSDAPVIKRESPFATPLELYLRKKELIPPQKVTPRMLRGLRLEPVARRLYEAETGIPMPARLRTHLGIPYMRASFDGLNVEARGAIEIKAPGKEDHLEALKGNVPKKYISQCVHNLFVGERLDWIDYWSYHPKFEGAKKTARIRITRNNRLERELLAAEKDFRRCIETDTQPAPGPKEIPWPWPKYENKGENMKQRTKLTLATTRDLVETIAKLRELGVKNLEMDGLSFQRPEDSARQDEEEAREPRPVCEHCGARKSPSNHGGFYCKPCWQQWKDSKN